jgi:hypothetical protein
VVNQQGQSRQRRRLADPEVHQALQPALKALRGDKVIRGYEVIS